MCGLTHVWGVRRRAFGLMSRSGSGRTAWPRAAINIDTANKVRLRLSREDSRARTCLVGIEKSKVLRKSSVGHPQVSRSSLARD